MTDNAVFVEVFCSNSMKLAIMKLISTFYRNFVFLTFEVFIDVHIAEPGSWLISLQLHVLIAPIVNAKLVKE
jgi:hypothetical protein